MNVFLIADIPDQKGGGDEIFVYDEVVEPAG